MSKGRTKGRITQKRVHVCRTATYYCCYPEPNERCPVHGTGEWPPRCGECGKFMPGAVRHVTELAIAEEVSDAPKV